MFITLDYLKTSFKEFNKLYFNNELPTPQFKIGRGTTRLGYFQSRRHSHFHTTLIISISQYNGLRTQKDINHTLIHEMIHLWQFVNGYTDSHGTSFKRKAETIRVESNGLYNIKRLHNGVELENGTKPESIPTIRKPKSVCVFATYSKTENLYWLFGCANTNYNTMQSFFRRNQHNWDLLGYWETNDNDLLKLHRCRTRLRGRKFTKEMFKQFANEKKLHFLLEKLG